MHKRARLTPKGREVLIHRLLSGQRMAEVAQAMGISETSARKWWRRHHRGEGRPIAVAVRGAVPGCCDAPAIG
jgi:transposase-like protein